MRPLRAATLSRLRTVQAGGVENAKELARVVKALDDEARGIAARELRELLLGEHGIDLREDRINRSRYVARLLYALDPEHGCPAAIDGVDDAETLYLVQRLHEVKGTPHAELLETLGKYQGRNLSTVQIRQRMKDAVARAQDRATSESRATWRQPLLRVPGDVCDTLNRGFSAFAEHHGATQQQSAVLLGEVLAQPITHLPTDVQRRLNTVLLTYAEALGLDLAAGALHLCDVLEQVPAEQWQHLHKVVTNPPKPIPIQEEGNADSRRSA